MTTFTLNFLATTFTLSDADSTTTATADFSDGSFLGVNFLLDALSIFQPNFALIPGVIDSSDAYFCLYQFDCYRQ
ncbi:hypothetical protein [Methylocucumis oryzae]|uniref:Uncharacterized protein n=1 Tax=Methylocucumis oryzae TaxID=1632867 RepID=A0A0F3IM11_9GAMM|nr:hypothetical protein [Methylocucumis oryzae]KJV07702.1 hypothetical protein VZ94_02895 [Methylocucumis oryzae]